MRAFVLFFLFLGLSLSVANPYKPTSKPTYNYKSTYKYPFNPTQPPQDECDMNKKKYYDSSYGYTSGGSGGSGYGSGGSGYGSGYGSSSTHTYDSSSYDSSYDSSSYDSSYYNDNTNQCSNDPWVMLEPDGTLQKPIGYTRIADPDPAMNLTLHFVLKHDAKKMKSLKKKIDHISDPLHRDYGKWLERDDLTAYSAADDAGIQKITDYLECEGIDAYRIVANRDAIQFTATVSQIEDMLNTKLGAWQFDITGTIHYLTVCHYYLPAPLAAITCLVTTLMRPLNDGSNGVARSGSGTATPPPTRAPRGIFEVKKKHNLFQVPTGPFQPLPSRNWTERGTWPDACTNACQGLITPQVIRNQYRIDPNDASSSDLMTQTNSTTTYPSYSSPKKNCCEPKSFDTTIAVVELNTQFFDRPDLRGFADACHEQRAQAQSVNRNDPAVCLVGTGEACKESLMNLQLVGALAKPKTLPSYDFLRDAFDWTLQVNDEENPPYVFSFSYGVDERHVSVDYHHCLNDQLMKLAARGITVVVAAGDNGVYGALVDDNDGEPGNRNTFSPVLPASSPYVLSVGGTELFGNRVGNVEACSPPGGGGFSGSFPRPSYQDAHVIRYFANNTLPSPELYNTRGRGYPDISVLYGAVVPYCYSANLAFRPASGTSASAPVIASIISLLNGVRASVGGPRLGFVNPWLYLVYRTFPEAFNDVWTSQNTGDGPTGFNATEGWDPCTGLGTPRYDALKGIILKEFSCDKVYGPTQKPTYKPAYKPKGY